MTTPLGELRDVVKDTLESRGILPEMRAKMRAAVFSALDDPAAPIPEPPPENLLINELIREYLDFNELPATASVFVLESRQPDSATLSRQFLSYELGLDDRSSVARESEPRVRGRPVPLLYEVVGYVKALREARRAAAVRLDRASETGPRSAAPTSPTLRTRGLAEREVLRVAGSSTTPAATGGGSGAAAGMAVTAAPIRGPGRTVGFAVDGEEPAGPRRTTERTGSSDRARGVVEGVATARDPEDVPGYRGVPAVSEYDEETFEELDESGGGRSSDRLGAVPGVPLVFRGTG